jgi:hypothetical protein
MAESQLNPSTDLRFCLSAAEKALRAAQERPE